MQGPELERKAGLRRLVKKLRADCIYYGADETVVNTMKLEQLMALRGRLLRELQEEAPKGAAWPG